LEKIYDGPSAQKNITHSTLGTNRKAASPEDTAKTCYATKPQRLEIHLKSAAISCFPLDKKNDSKLTNTKTDFFVFYFKWRKFLLILVKFVFLPYSFAISAPTGRSSLVTFHDPCIPLMNNRGSSSSSFLSDTIT
jgi:hypothetical protein